MNCVTTLWKLDATKFEAVLAPLVTRSAYLLRQRAAVGAGQQGHLNTVALQQLLSGLRDASCVVARPDYLQVGIAFQGSGCIMCSCSPRLPSGKNSDSGSQDASCVVAHPDYIQVKIVLLLARLTSARLYLEQLVHLQGNDGDVPFGLQQIFMIAGDTNGACQIACTACVSATLHSLSTMSS